MANTTKKKKPVPRKLNAREAVWGFMEFLIFRDNPLIFSKNHHADAVIQITSRFCDANDLPEVREQIPLVVKPPHTDQLTNVEPPKDCCRSYTAKEMAEEIIKRMQSMNRTDWNEIMARVVSHVVKTYNEDFAQYERDSDVAYKNRTAAHQRQTELEKIVSGEIKYFP